MFLPKSFVSELTKHAFRMKVPPVSLSRFGIGSRSGAMVRTPRAMATRISPRTKLQSTQSKKVTLADRTLGTKIVPTTKTVPNPLSSGSLVR